jgi:hypothetical protein
MNFFIWKLYLAESVFLLLSFVDEPFGKSAFASGFNYNGTAQNDFKIVNRK